MDLIHVTMASDGRMPLFPEEAERRAAVQALVRVSGPVLVLFYLVDEHLHAVWACSLERAGRLAQALAAALRVITSSRLAAARRRRVESRSHLEWLVRYVLTQGQHHGLTHQAALWTGSCLQDIVGARDIPGFELQAFKYLARMTASRALELVGVRRKALAPATDDQVLSAGSERLVDAVAAAACLGPTLVGRERRIVQVRATAVQLGRSLDFSTLDLAEALKVTPRAILKLGRYPGSESLARAARVRLALEDLVAVLPPQDAGLGRPRAASIQVRR